MQADGSVGFRVRSLPEILKRHSARTFTILSYYREYFSERSAFCGSWEWEESGAAGDAMDAPRLAEMSSDQCARHCHTFSKLSALVCLLYKFTIRNF
jgi:hypothetical protein